MSAKETVRPTEPALRSSPRRREPAPVELAGARRGSQVSVQALCAFYGEHEALRNVSLDFEPNRITAIIGPSGCGKSTLIRCMNRMHEEIPDTRVEGKVLIDGIDVYDPETNPVAVRMTIGMVFQKPNPFPTMSVYKNVAAGLRLTGRGRQDVDQRVQATLRMAGLWDEVKDRLDKPGTELSGGQQQRLCIARTLAVEPEVILMDEPCSALDPGSTLKIEELIADLKDRYTIVMVTHNMQEAARVADKTAFLHSGELIEFAPTNKIFTNPDDQRTEDYVTGKVG